MKQYGFMVVSRTNRWQVATPGSDAAETFDSKEEAEKVRSGWRSKDGTEKRLAFEKEAARRASERKQFIEAVRIEMVRIKDPGSPQNDHRRPTARFPDGSEVQFEEGTPESEIEANVEAKALELYPKVDQRDFVAGKHSRPRIEEIRVWKARLLLDGEKRTLPDISAWDFFYPMENVAETLNSLAGLGWSVVHVSEDRGLYTSDLAMNMSAPLIVRYLLVREKDE